MKWSAAISVTIGLAVLIALVVTHDAGRIAALVAGAGWGLAVVVGLHVPQLVLSALGWRALICDPQRPSLPALTRLRWIRESVNALLPVAQIGGDFVRGQLLARRGVALRMAVASVCVDLAVEMTALIVFAVMGLVPLLSGTHDRHNAMLVAAATLLCGALTAAFVTAQRFGLLKLIERTLPRIAERSGWAALGQVAGLHDAALALYRERSRLWGSAGWHLASLIAGVAEIYAGMWAIGMQPDLRAAFVIESLGQAVRAVGFAIPGALGVQEGGYILICALFGIGAQDAIALSLVRRVRDLALGIPGLVSWRVAEGMRSAAPRGGQTKAPMEAP